MDESKPAAKKLPPAQAAAPLAAPVPVAPVTGGPVTPDQLTPEEQMELFAKDLKENDWGHQPC